ncbi:Uncharacterised protein [Mycobacteroides abscessus subsp. abscessus]|nr:Uncharacterised protein [Mycobacteroides abscessus subsp. abscessus]
MDTFDLRHVVATSGGEYRVDLGDCGTTIFVEPRGM